MSAPQHPPAIPGCRYDGQFLGTAFLFTDLEAGSPSYGGTFAVTVDELTPDAALAARDRQRAAFSNAQPPRP